MPDTDLSKEALGFRVQNYGMTKHRHLFTTRQLVVPITFCDLVGEAREKVLADAGSASLPPTEAKASADAVRTYLAQAAIGPDMAVFSRYAKVLENAGSAMIVRTALALVNQTLDEVLAEQEGEFDADTRWAVAWFNQSGFAEGPYGIAETLCTAKNTGFSGMVEAGILCAKGGKLRLLTPAELPSDWDPARDARLTIREIVHQLIRVLDGGETQTARLLAAVRAVSADKAEAARDLAYRLFTLSERRKRAQDALACNALVTSWPEIARLAQDWPSQPVQQRLL
ncbi:MAG: hypothetical protein ACRERU_23245 [Methylococcales bacterium]